MQWLAYAGEVEERNVAASPEPRVDAVVPGLVFLGDQDCLVAENAAALPKQTSLQDTLIIP